MNEWMTEIKFILELLSDFKKRMTVPGRVVRVQNHKIRHAEFGAVLAHKVVFFNFRQHPKIIDYNWFQGYGKAVSNRWQQIQTFKLNFFQTACNKSIALTQETCCPFRSIHFNSARVGYRA